MRVNLERSNTGRELVVYLDDGTRVCAVPVVVCAETERVRLESSLDAVRGEAKTEAETGYCPNCFCGSCEVGL